tara:strand:+ start:561 stop:1220 length:660 start_codon:yes stop_codon:yes gene_type:complete
MKNSLILFFLLVFLSCSQNSEWITLFDGKNVNGLRGYKMENFPWDSWVIKNATLKTIPGKHGVDLISVDTFEDFELELEWKLQSGGNSGIFYFASEEGDYIWQSAPEMQVLDNLGHQDRFRKVTSAGALYDLIAPSKEMVKPIGEFNKVKIISKNKEIEHWLNGEKIVEYKVGSEYIQNLISKSKFNSMPLFFKSSYGHIGLQGDHGEVWYRNIRIRKL